MDCLSILKIMMHKCDVVGEKPANIVYDSHVS